MSTCTGDTYCGECGRHVSEPCPKNDGGDEAPAVDIPNAADPKRLGRQRDRARREEEEARAFWRAVFGSPIGRREMWRLLALGHAFEERFATPDKPREATWILAGEQRLAFRLYRTWQAFDLDAVALMHRENDPAIQSRP